MMAGAVKGDAMASLTISNVKKHFGPLHILKGIDIAIGDGEFWSWSAPRAAASPPCST